jgi:hypothetical protein
MKITNSHCEICTSQICILILIKETCYLDDAIESLGRRSKAGSFVLPFLREAAAWKNRVEDGGACFCAKHMEDTNGFCAKHMEDNVRGKYHKIEGRFFF